MEVSGFPLHRTTGLVAFLLLLSSLNFHLATGEQADQEGIGGGGEAIEEEEESGALGGEALLLAERRRTKRYPEHLDPNFPFWVRIGECPSSLDGSRQHFCPTPNNKGRWVCVDDFQLCDGIKNCPNAEDESTNYCLFYRVLKRDVDLLTRSITALNKEEVGKAAVSLPPRNTAPQGEEKEEGPGQESDLLTANMEVIDSLQPESNFISRFHRQSGQFTPAAR